MIGTPWDELFSTPLLIMASISESDNRLSSVLMLAIRDVKHKSLLVNQLACRLGPRKQTNEQTLVEVGCFSVVVAVAGFVIAVVGVVVVVVVLVVVLVLAAVVVIVAVALY
jgi:hypothetical protein